jgi:hypothetical protein
MDPSIAGSSGQHETVAEWMIKASGVYQVPREATPETG